MIVRPYAPGIAAINHRVDEVGDAVLDAVYWDAFEDAPVNDRNSPPPEPAGTLKRSLRRVKAGGVRRVYVGSNHWHFVEFGTMPHIIRPRYKNALWWPTAGFPRAKVNHPGATANPFMRRSVYQRRVIRVSSGGFVAVS